MTTPPRPKGRQARLLEAREITRRAILDAALDLFITHGYAQVSIRNIAARVEYSPGAIYGYFASKDEIFYALAEEGLRDLGARELADAPSADPVEDVRASAWRLYEFSKEQPQYFALVFLDPRVPRVSREYERFAFISEMRNRALARVDRCVAEGLFPADDVRRGRAAAAVGAGRRHRRAAPVAPHAGRGRSRSAGARRDRDDDCRHPRRRAAACAASPARSRRVRVRGARVRRVRARGPYRLASHVPQELPFHGSTLFLPPPAGRRRSPPHAAAPRARLPPRRRWTRRPYR